MRALITGGGGFLGSRIAEMLVERGDRVRVFGRSSYPRLERVGVECMVGDIRDSQAVNQAARHVDTVFHVAALAGVWGPRRTFFEINSRGTANVIQACLLNRVQKLVYTSTPSVVFNGRDIVEGDEELPHATRFLAAYPASKSVAEKMVIEANGWESVVEEKRLAESEIKQRHGSTVHRLSTCALRPHLIWGPGDPHLVPRLIRMVEAGRLKCVGGGANRVSLTYIDNAARAHLLAADALAPDAANAGQAYFINDREPVVLWDWINDLFRRLRLPPVKRKLPFRLAYAVGAGLELVYHLSSRLGEPPMTRFVAEQMAKSHSFSWRKAARDFGYEPLVDNESGLRKLVEALNK